jgi:broad specificity phosphatase PhoE
MSARVVLVRHGRAAAGWGQDPDPGLDDTGRAQAEALADALAPIGPLPILVSPLRRTRQTAEPLERRWGVTATVAADVGEVPSPTDDLAERAEWLRRAMAGAWDDLGPDLRAWRRRVVDRLARLERDTVVVTHFVAINAAVSEATGDPRMISCRPDYCSQTVLDVDGGRLRVVSLGGEAVTQVL